MQETKHRDFLEHKGLFHLAPRTHQENVRGKSFFSQKPDRKSSYYGQTGSHQQRYGRYNYSTANLLQHGFKSRETNLVGIKKGSPIDKKIILVKKYSRRPISRKIETFC